MDQIESAVLRIYKQQPSLGKRFSTTKSVLEIAPVCPRKIIDVGFRVDEK